MSIVKKALYGTLALTLGMGAVSVSAQEAPEETTKPRAVLFKIHEIKPVENTDGVVTHCDFLVTFYNRTTDSFRSAKIDMGWTDEVTERYSIDEAEKETPEAPVRTRAVRSNAPASLGEITSTVDMPSLGSYKQTTVKASVKTQKCFVLLDNVNFNVESCSIVGKDDDNAGSARRNRINASRSTSECANLFEYVDSKNPEYYGEFKNISFSEQERLLNDEKKQDTSDIESAFQGIVENFQKAEQIMTNIK